MGYREIQAAEMNVLQPITAALLAQLRDNIAGICEGGAVSLYPVDTNAFTISTIPASTKIAPGTIPGEDKLAASSITNANIQSAAVGFNNLRVAAKSITATAGAIATGADTTTERAWILGWHSSGNTLCSQYQCGPGAGETAGNAAQNWLTSTTPAMHHWIHERSGTIGATAQVLWWYISASPPYKLDGHTVPIFAYAIQRANGSLRSIMISHDPPWTGAGMDITPTEYRDGKPWIKRQGMIRVPKSELSGEKLRSKAHRDQLLAQIRGESEMIEYEITPTIKNSGMAAMPHPFPDLADTERPILIDPLGDIAEDIAELHRIGMAGHIIGQGDILIGDEYALENHPEGVAVVKAAWR